MSAVLNSNVASLMASKNLLGAQSKLADSVERLSSGLRINRARDDAAGLGVANSLTAQINSSNQGVRNLNDGISMVQTAEGAITAASEMAQRILMLATQGANGTLGVTERTAIQTEMNQLLKSIDSIGARTKFSGNDLLGFDPRATAVAAKFSLQSSNVTTDTVSLGSGAFLNIGGTYGSAATNGTTITNATSTLTMTAAPSPNIVGSTVYKLASGTYTAVSTVTAVSGTSVTLAATSGGAVTWTAATDTIVFSGQLTQKLSSTVDDLSLSQSVNATGITSSTTSTASAAFQMVQRAADAYVIKLGEQRGLLGAYQNQIEYTVSNVAELSSNLSSARSRVIDTDYAAETASLTKGQILQQAATAMLAQANQMPNVILTLLK